MKSSSLQRKCQGLALGAMAASALACSAPASEGPSALGGPPGAAPASGGATAGPTGSNTSTPGAIDIDLGVVSADPTMATAMSADGLCGRSNVRGTLRDFTDLHPDFENLPQKNSSKTYLGEMGIVAATLGADRKPVYAGPAAGTFTTSGPANFDQWYRSIDGVNMPIFLDVPFAEETPGSGISVFDSGQLGFFPIDGMLFGNGPPANGATYTHNYHFTFEFHTTFAYTPGQMFSFRGDDDVWVFINNQLACDIGGIHAPANCIAMLDTLGLTADQEYPLDFFFAERHITNSNFRIETTLVFTECDLIDVIQ